MAGMSSYRDPAGLFGLQRLNRFLDEAFAGVPSAEQGSVITSAWFAPTDVSEDTNGIQISMELPGVDPDDVRLSLENNILTIRGEKRQQIDQKNERRASVRAHLRNLRAHLRSAQHRGSRPDRSPI